MSEKHERKEKNLLHQNGMCTEVCGYVHVRIKK